MRKSSPESVSRVTKSSAFTPSYLLDTISHKVIPWGEHGGMQHVVVARQSWRDLVLPPGVTISHKKLTRLRRSAHGPRLAGDASAPVAQWDDDDQEVTRISLLLCVVSGRADFQVGDYVLHCPEGTFIFIPPGVSHPRGERSHLEGENREHGSCDLLWFSHQGRRVQCWFCHSRGDSHHITNGIFLLYDRLVHFIEFMQEEALTHQADYEKLFEGSLRLFLHAVHREIKFGRFLEVGLNENEKNAQDDNYDPIERAQEYIQANLSRSLTIDKVAYAIHMSRSQFTRRFHAQTGQTFTEYVIARRLEQAQLFLCESSWSVEQITEFIGFRSASYFHSLFHRTFGMTPIEYRQRNLQKK